MTPKIIAHRGVTRNDQENTLPAFHKAFSEGADGLEIDVRLSKDEKPIIFHDEDTSRLFKKSLEIKKIILLNGTFTDKYIFCRDSPPKIIANKANKALNNVVTTITFLLSNLSEKYPMGP